MIEKAWESIRLALERRAPDVLANLREPASAQAISAFEAELGFALPEDLRASLRIHDGEIEDDWSRYTFADFPYYGIEAMRAARAIAAEVADSLDLLEEEDDLVAWQDLVSGGVGRVEGPVKARNYNPLWVCIGSFNGDVFRYVDLDPASGGRVGQVIEVEPEAVSWKVVAPSFAKFLEVFAAGLEQGHIEWGEAERGSSSLFVRDLDGPPYLRDVEVQRASSPDELDLVSIDALDHGERAEVQARVVGIVGTASAMRLVLRIDNPMPRGERAEVVAMATRRTKGFGQLHLHAIALIELVRRPAELMGVPDEVPAALVVERVELLAKSGS